ncbi:MAG: hypothetical protein EON90_06630 [Brevundimonas sp.]|nr:MAG: hypothetical protein EON90_06630 [Brevundimonas sp.]
MNASRWKIAALICTLGVATGLSGCVGSFNPRTDPTSPVAPRVQELVDAHREYPRWENFPRSAEPMPEPAQLAERVGTLTAGRSALAADVARIEWQTTGDPEAFARDVQARVAAVPVAPATQQTQAEIDEFARRTRERGRAPPPVDRR